MNPALRTINDVWLLALVTWREARNEPRLGKLAVAYSILNRVARPSWWGKDVPSVVWKKWQYSSMTDPNDRQLAKLPSPYVKVEWEAWLECLEVALRAYMSEEPNPAPGADSYFADTIPPPKWADPQRQVVKIGHHLFFDLDADHEKEP